MSRVGLGGEMKIAIFCEIFYDNSKLTVARHCRMIPQWWRLFPGGKLSVYYKWRFCDPGAGHSSASFVKSPTAENVARTIETLVFCSKIANLDICSLTEIPKLLTDVVVHTHTLSPSCTSFSTVLGLIPRTVSHPASFLSPCQTE